MISASSSSSLSIFPTLWGWTAHFLDGSPPCCPVSWVNVGNIRHSSVFCDCSVHDLSNHESLCFLFSHTAGTLRSPLSMASLQHPGGVDLDENGALVGEDLAMVIGKGMYMYLF